MNNSNNSNSNNEQGNIVIVDDIPNNLQVLSCRE